MKNYYVEMKYGETAGEGTLVMILYRRGEMRPLAWEAVGYGGRLPSLTRYDQAMLQDAYRTLVRALQEKLDGLGIACGEVDFNTQVAFPCDAPLSYEAYVQQVEAALKRELPASRHPAAEAFLKIPETADALRALYDLACFQYRQGMVPWQRAADAAQKEQNREAAFSQRQIMRTAEALRLILVSEGSEPVLLN